MIDLNPYLKPSAAATFLGFQSATLACWRTSGTGPAYIIAGRSIRYGLDALREWAAASPAERRKLEEDAACHKERLNRVKRLRGRAGTDLRRQRIANEPYCRDCFAHGVTRPSEQVDHIIPIAKGGTDNEDNIRCLCRECHAARTRQQFYGQ